MSEIGRKVRKKLGVWNQEQAIFLSFHVFYPQKVTKHHILFLTLHFFKKNSEVLTFNCHFFSNFAPYKEEKVKMNGRAYMTRTLTEVLLSSLVFVSCVGTTNVQDEKEELAILNSKQDSLIMAKMDIDPASALTTIDSLEKEQIATPARLYYFRALAYKHLGKKRQTEDWCEKALRGDTLLNENLEFFYDACDIYSTVLSERNENVLALEVAIRGYDVALNDSSQTGRHWIAILLHDKGYCEMQLGKIDEAEQSFSMAYITTKQIAAANSKYSNLQMCARVAYNIVDSYTSTGQYDKAKAWLEEAEEAVAELVSSPECSKEQREGYIGGLTMQEALILVCTGEPEKANKAYQKALKMDYAETGVGILERATYLEKAERWDELRELLPRIDSLYGAWGTPEMMEHWNQYQNKI